MVPDFPESYKDRCTFLLAAIFKSRLFKMAATVMTVEFGTIYHYWLKILKIFCAILWTDTKIYLKICDLRHFGLK